MLCLGKISENPESNDAWEQRLGCMKSSRNYRNFDRIDGELAREMGSPRQVSNRRRRTRKGPEPACVQTPNPDWVAYAGGEG